MALQWIQYAFRESRPEEDFKEQLKRKPKGGEGKEQRAAREKEERDMEWDEVTDSESDDFELGEAKRNLPRFATLEGMG